MYEKLPKLPTVHDTFGMLKSPQIKIKIVRSPSLINRVNILERLEFGDKLTPVKKNGGTRGMSKASKNLLAGINR
jgi:hypothetical protein